MFRLLFLLLLTFSCSKSYSEEKNNVSILAELKNTNNHKILVNIIEKSLFLNFFDSQDDVARTIYAPTDYAFSKLSPKIMEKILNNEKKLIVKFIMMHIFAGNSLDQNVIKTIDLKISLDGSVVLLNENRDVFIKDIVIRKKPTFIKNTTIIPIDCVMYLQPSLTDKRLDQALVSKYEHTTCCLQDKKEVDSFLSEL